MQAVIVRLAAHAIHGADETGDKIVDRPAGGARQYI